MSIPKPHRWAYEACAAHLPDDHPARVRAAKAIESDARSRRAKLAKSRPRRKAEDAQHLVETGATRSVRRVVMARAGGRSELTQARGILEMDHYFGRDIENPEVCWMLTREEHRDRTDNRIPGTSTYSRLWWHERFRAHCQRHHLGRALALLEPLIALEEGQHPTPGGTP